MNKQDAKKLAHSGTINKEKALQILEAWKEKTGLTGMTKINPAVTKAEFYRIYSSIFADKPYGFIPDERSVTYRKNCIILGNLLYECS